MLEKGAEAAAKKLAQIHLQFLTVPHSDDLF